MGIIVAITNYYDYYINYTQFENWPIWKLDIERIININMALSILFASLLILKNLRMMKNLLEIDDALKMKLANLAIK